MRRASIFPIALFLLLAAASPVAGQTTITCDSFDVQAAAQLILNPGNADALDPDGDGIACEELPSSSSPLGDNDEAETGQSDEPVVASGDLTQQEQEYFDALLEDFETFAQAIGDVGQLFTQAGSDPSLLFDQEWILDIAAQFDTLEQVGLDAQTLEPSTRQQHIHDLWLEVNRMTGLAIDDITSGVDNLDPDAINLGTARILYATNLINDMTAALEAFAVDPNTPIEPSYIIGPVADCEPFDDFAEAQEYYAAHPEEQATIDPNVDGRACEVYFGE